MKKALSLVFLFSSVLVKSQTGITINLKNSIHYKSNLISNVLIQNYSEFSDYERVIFDKALGVDVDIFVDTVFKKYTIVYNDENNKKQVMVYSYIRDYFLDSPNKHTALDKIYLMEFGGLQFMLIDDILLPPMHMLEIRYEEKRAKNCTLFFRIRNLEKSN